MKCRQGGKDHKHKGALCAVYFVYVKTNLMQNTEERKVEE